jgi:hypothetical protein
MLSGPGINRTPLTLVVIESALSVRASGAGAAGSGHSGQTGWKSPGFHCGGCGAGGGWSEPAPGGMGAGGTVDTGGTGGGSAAAPGAVP